MIAREHTQAAQEEFERNREKLLAFRASYDRDEALRRRIDAGDGGPLLEMLGLDFPSSANARVVLAQEDVHYVIMPPDPSVVLRDRQLETVTGGSAFGTAGSVLTAGSFACSCVPSSFGTVSSAGTASSN